MRVRLAGMVWIRKQDMPPGMAERLRKELTIVPRKPKGYGKSDDEPTAPIKCFSENMMEFAVPRSWWFSRSNQDHDYTLEMSADPAHLPTTIVHSGPYKEQGEVVASVVNRYRGFNEEAISTTGDRLGGIVHGKTGFGKTVVSLAIASALGVKTFVLVHKEFLLKQWIKRINEFLPMSNVGVVRGAKCQLEEADIAVGMIQSISKAIENGGKYEALWNWPGLVICDEVHRIGAPTFSVVLKHIHAKYRLGLTATPRRRDGADKVFWWNIGDIVYTAKTEMPSPGVRVRKFNGLDCSSVIRKRGIAPPIVVNALAGNKPRNSLIADDIVKALDAKIGRKLFVLSERLEQLRDLEGRVSDARPDVSTSFYVGQWFTGEVVEAMKNKGWTQGREKLIADLYDAYSRKRSKNIGCEVIQSKDGGGELLHYQVAGAQAFVAPKDPGEAHVIVMHAEDYEEITGNRLRASTVAVSLESLTMVQMYDVARKLGIQQKRIEKLKKLTDEELDAAERARCIFATFQMVAEGVDIKALDTLFMASPVSDVEQAVGRIRRFCVPEEKKCQRLCQWRAGSCEGKEALVVCDYVDTDSPLSAKRFGWRKKFYRESGFKMGSG